MHFAEICAILLLLVLNFEFGLADTLIRDQTTNTTYCNDTENFTLNEFDGVVCSGKIRVYRNRTVTMADATVAIVEWEIIAIENFNSTFFGIAFNTSGYYFFVNFTQSVTHLPDLNYTEHGKSAWELGANRFWTVGKSHIGQQSKFYVVDPASNYSSAFYIIASGERPVNIFWNGTALVGVVERNSTYFTTPFLVNQRKTTLGTSNQTLLIIDRNSKTVSIIPEMDNYTLICWADCKTSAVVSSYSSMYATESSLSSLAESSRLQESSHRTLSPPTWTLPETVTITVSDNNFPVAQNYQGLLVIQSGSTLTIPLLSGEFFEGDTINLFNFSQLQGAFTALEIQTDSCQLYSGSLVYTDTSIDLVITSVTNLCTNNALRQSFIFQV